MDISLQFGMIDEKKFQHKNITMLETKPVLCKLVILIYMYLS